MLRTWTMSRLAMALVAGVLMGPVARSQEKPKDTPAAGAAVQAKAGEASKEAKKEPAPPKPRIAVFRLAGAVKETPRDEVFNFGGETGVPLLELVTRMDKAAKESWRSYLSKEGVALLDESLREYVDFTTRLQRKDSQRAAAPAH